MPSFSKNTFCRLLMVATPLLFGFAVFHMLRRQEPFYTWFYSFAWWSYILFIESFLFFRGHRSTLFAEPMRFLILLPLSVTIWLIFELFNFRLQNWHYLCLPPQRGLRWLGYSIAFATVLPAMFSTKNFLESLGAFRECSKVSINVDLVKGAFTSIGIAMLVLPVLFPKVFFPLVWLAVAFLLEPLNYRIGADSLLRDMAKGSPRMLYLLLLSGLICGILWECWNYWAGSKWIYTIPYLGFLKVFEMPVFGFLGFPPFTVECYAMVSSFFLLADRIHKKWNATRAVIFWVLTGALVITFDLFVYLGIDAFTVVSFRTPAR